MPSPRTKTQILKRLTNERKLLEEEFATLTPEQMVQPGVVGEWSVKDVLAHLADWEAHMPIWIEAARRGDPVVEIEPGLSWRQFHEFNQRIFERHRNQSLVEVLKTFRGIHLQFMEMVENMPETEMFAPGRYGFVGKGTIYTWLSHYASHDSWARKKIRGWLTEKEG